MQNILSSGTRRPNKNFSQCNNKQRRDLLTMHMVIPLVEPNKNTDKETRQQHTPCQQNYKRLITLDLK